MEHSVLGLRLLMMQGAVLQNILAMGADSYESGAEREMVRARDGAILDKNLRIGSDVRVISKDLV